jgi:dipeptide transport system permease protein
LLPYIIRRFFHLIPTFIGVSIIAFSFIRLLPGDPVQLMSGERVMSPERHAVISQQLGLDRPLYEQWGDYVWSLGTRGDFGETLSLRGGFPARPILMAALPRTLWLAAGGFALALLLAVPLGLLIFRLGERHAKQHGKLKRSG